MRVGGIRGQRFSSGDVLFGFDSVFGLTLVQFIWFDFGSVGMVRFWFHKGRLKKNSPFMHCIHVHSMFRLTLKTSFFKQM